MVFVIYYMRKITLTLVILCSCFFLQAQDYNLAQLAQEGKFTVHDRTMSHGSASSGVVSMDARESDGLVILDGIPFTKGTIELQIKGENNPGKSFVGIAFNLRSKEEYEAVYFRPFNFVATEPARRSHMVQYIYHPEFTWRNLRETRTDEFENNIETPPDPDSWFNVRIVVSDSDVKVFIDEQTQPSLEIVRLTEGTTDRLALWTGFGSKGSFRNLTLTHN